MSGISTATVETLTAEVRSGGKEKAMNEYGPMSRQEDETYGRFARDVLDAASAGVDVSFLWSCPDLHRLAMDREGGRRPRAVPRTATVLPALALIAIGVLVILTALVLALA
jgi:hypothetical protein